MIVKIILLHFSLPAYLKCIPSHPAVFFLPTHSSGDFVSFPVEFLRQSFRYFPAASIK